MEEKWSRLGKGEKAGRRSMFNRVAHMVCIKKLRLEQSAEEGAGVSQVEINQEKYIPGKEDG